MIKSNADGILIKTLLETDNHLVTVNLKKMGDDQGFVDDPRQVDIDALPQWIQTAEAPL